MTLKHSTLEDIELMIKMDFQEELTMALNNLDELINKLKTEK